MKDKIILFESSLRDALRIADERHPKAHPNRRAAFANSVAYALTGMCGGYGGPSVREHAAARVTAGSLRRFDEACKLVEPVVFGPLTELHRQVWRQERCFQDDPADLAALK